MRRLLPWVLAALAVGLLALVVAILPAHEPASVHSSGAAGEPEPRPRSDAELRPALAEAVADLETPAEAERKEVVPESGLHTLANPARSGRVAGRVLGGGDGDSPLVDASVTLWRSRARNPREHATRTDASGSFALEDVAFAYWFAEMSAPGHRAVRVVVPVTPEQPTAAPVARLPFWRDVGVNLVDASGLVASVEQVGLRAAFAHALTLGIGPRDAREKTELKGWQRLRSFRGPSQLDEQDAAAWRVRAYTQYGDCLHVLVGPHVVASHPLGSVSDPIEILVDPRAIQDVLTQASVRVVSGIDERPIADARVEFRFGSVLVDDVAADSQGVAVLRDVPHVSLMARARSPRHVSDILPVEGGGELVVIRLAPGWGIAGRVEAPAGKPRYVPGNTAIESAPSVGLWRVDPESERLGSRIQTRPLQDGRFQFDPVLPGTYAISCAVDSMGSIGPDRILNRTPNHVLVVHVTNHELPDAVVPWIEEVQNRERTQSKGFTGRKAGGVR